MASKKIVLTGGGTAGHVTPNIALIPELQKKGYEVHYIGSYDGMEKHLIEELGIDYTGIATGKLRRYFDIKNFSDPFRVIKGYREAYQTLKKLRPDVVFSKGGYVAVPVVFAAKRLHIPSIIHESDMSPGLANRLCIPRATYICANFPEALAELPEEKSVLTGTPIRRELFLGSKTKGLKFMGFNDKKPVLLVMGGSLGAQAVNEAVRKALPELLKDFQVCHLCGKGKTDESLQGTTGYVQYEYIQDELRDLFASTDLVVSRAGANAICELVALHLPNILIPLPKTGQSRGDQVLNAESFSKQGYSRLLEEKDLTTESLLAAVKETYENREVYRSAMAASSQSDATGKIIELIGKCVGKKA